jgi:hypothetical protein
MNQKCIGFIIELNYDKDFTEITTLDCKNINGFMSKVKSMFIDFINDNFNEDFELNNEYYTLKEI